MPKHGAVKIKPEKKKIIKDTEYYKFLRKAENEKKKGYDPKTKTWKAVKSVEKDKDTGKDLYEVGYGLRAKKGQKVSDKEVEHRMRKEAFQAGEDIRDTGLGKFSPKVQESLIPTMYNIGKTKTKGKEYEKAAGRGDIPTFEKELFSKEKGVNKVTVADEKNPGATKKVVSEGLHNRRQAEKKFFRKAMKKKKEEENA